VTLADFRINYRSARVHFVDPVRRRVVGDLRHLPGIPARAQASRVMDMLLAGPSRALGGAVVSLLPPGARLRANVAEAADGALIVDLTQLGGLDPDARPLIAAQIVLTLAEVNVGRVRLLADGAPLLADRPDLTRDDVAGTVGEVDPGAEVPALIAAGGRVSRLTGPEQGEALPGQAGNGAFDIGSAAVSPDGSRLAAVSRMEDRRSLLLGGDPDGGLVAAGVGAGTMTRPSWTPDAAEVWTVLDGTTVVRVTVDGAGGARVGTVGAELLTALGPVQDLRLSRDGMRVAAVVGGTLYVGAVTRSTDGAAVIRDLRRIRPADLGEVVAVDWPAADSLVVIGRRSDRPVSLVSVDGLNLQPVSPSNLTPPLTAVTAAPGRSLLVTDQGGVWSFAGGDLDTWRLVRRGVPDAVPFYPG
jgi:hypothetical protein